MIGRRLFDGKKLQLKSWFSLRNEDVILLFYSTAIVEFDNGLLSIG